MGGGLSILFGQMRQLIQTLVSLKTWVSGLFEVKFGSVENINKPESDGEICRVKGKERNIIQLSRLIFFSSKPNLNLTQAL